MSGLGDFTPEDLARLRQLAKRASDEQAWAAALDGPDGDVARYLQGLDDAIRQLAPDLTEDLRQQLQNDWSDDVDETEGFFEQPLDFRTYVLAYRTALIRHGVVVLPDEPFPTIE